MVDAFAPLGIEARRAASMPNGEPDLMVVDPGGVGARVQIRRRSLVNDSVAETLLVEAGLLDATVLVVGDRVTESARKLLTSRRGGYYDLRGHLALRTDGLLIDVETAPVTERAERTQALSGKAGLEVATALLMAPERGAGVRELARELGRSASTVSEVLTALRRDGLIEAARTVPDSRLFWQVSDRWSTPRMYLAQLPEPGDASGTTKPLRLGLDDIRNTPGWALTDSAAAAAYGAPMAVRSGQVLDFYVPDQVVLRRATTLLGAAGSAAESRAAVRVAPVPRYLSSPGRPRLQLNGVAPGSPAVRCAGPGPGCRPGSRDPRCLDARRTVDPCLVAGSALWAMRWPPWSKRPRTCGC